MIRFAHPEYGFFFIALIPVATILIWFFIWKRKALSKLGERNLVQLLLPDYLPGRSAFKIGLVMIALVSILIGLMNFQFQGTEKKVHHEGSDFVLLMDVSNSMLAEDVKPSRIEAAKSAAQQLLLEFPDSRFSIVAFAGSASTLLPLTPDHAVAQMILDNLSVNSAEVQGSDIGGALDEALQALPENRSRYSAIILFSDGEDHEHHINEAMQKLTEAGVMVCSVGVGTESGRPIPLSDSDFKKDIHHDNVITKLNTSLLTDAARESNGVFIKLQAGNTSLKNIIGRLSDLQKNKFDEKLYVRYESAFQYFLFPALLILLLETFITTRKKAKSKAS